MYVEELRFLNFNREGEHAMVATMNAVEALTGTVQICQGDLTPQEWADVVLKALSQTDFSTLQGMYPLGRILKGAGGTTGISREVPDAVWRAAIPKGMSPNSYLFTVGDFRGAPDKWDSFLRPGNEDELVRLRQMSVLANRRGQLFYLSATWLPRVKYHDKWREVCTRWAELKDAVVTQVKDPQAELAELFTGRADIPIAMLHELHIAHVHTVSHMEFRMKTCAKQKGRLQRILDALGEVC